VGPQNPNIRPKSQTGQRNTQGSPSPEITLRPPFSPPSENPRFFPKGSGSNPQTCFWELSPRKTFGTPIFLPGFLPGLPGPPTQPLWHPETSNANLPSWPFPNSHPQSQPHWKPSFKPYPGKKCHQWKNPTFVEKVWPPPVKPSQYLIRQTWVEEFPGNLQLSSPETKFPRNYTSGNQSPVFCPESTLHFLEARGKLRAQRTRITGRPSPNLWIPFHHQTKANWYRKESEAQVNHWEDRRIKKWGWA